MGGEKAGVRKREYKERCPDWDTEPRLFHLVFDYS